MSNSHRQVRTYAATVACCCAAILLPALQASAQTVWIGVTKVTSSPSVVFEDTAQRFPAYGNPDMILGNKFNDHGRGYNLAISGPTLFSGRADNLHKWDPLTGADLGPLTVDSPLASHLLDALHGIGVAEGGDLLLTSFGYEDEQRTIARYTPTGSWVRDYSSLNLQHVQGTPAASTEAVFAVSRHNPGSGFIERVLMYKADGMYVGEFGSDLGQDFGDVAVMDDSLYVLDYDNGIHVFSLNGESLPLYSHVISLPATIVPDDTETDEMHAYGGYLYVAVGAEGRWYKMKLDGTQLGYYSVEPGEDLTMVGSLAVIPEPATMGLLAAGGLLAMLRRRRRN